MSEIKLKTEATQTESLRLGATAHVFDWREASQKLVPDVSQWWMN